MLVLEEWTRSGGRKGGVVGCGRTIQFLGSPAGEGDKIMIAFISRYLSPGPFFFYHQINFLPLKIAWQPWKTRKIGLRRAYFSRFPRRGNLG